MRWPFALLLTLLRRFVGRLFFSEYFIQQYSRFEQWKTIRNNYYYNILELDDHTFYLKRIQYRCRVQFETSNDKT